MPIKANPTGRPTAELTLPAAAGRHAHRTAARWGPPQASPVQAAALLLPPRRAAAAGQPAGVQHSAIPGEQHSKVCPSCHCPDADAAAQARWCPAWGCCCSAQADWLAGLAAAAEQQALWAGVASARGAAAQASTAGACQVQPARQCSNQQLAGARPPLVWQARLIPAVGRAIRVAGHAAALVRSAMACGKRRARRAGSPQLSAQRCSPWRIALQRCTPPPAHKGAGGQLARWSIASCRHAAQDVRKRPAQGSPGVFMAGRQLHGWGLQQRRAEANKALDRGRHRRRRGGSNGEHRS